MADFVPDVMHLEMGGHVAPRLEYPHPAQACEAMTGDSWRWGQMRRRWAIPYVSAGEDECFGEGACANGEPCGCFEVAEWSRARTLAEQHRQPIWWLP